MTTNTQQPKRLVAIDILRGLTVILMILVNNGAGKEIFATLKHSAWNGLTPCDLVFPFFLFIMGFSIFLSLKKTDFKWSTAIARKIAKRTILLFAIGLTINWFDKACGGNALDFEHLRVWGVMQRLAICYCAVALMAVAIPQRWFSTLVVTLLAIYSVILIVGNGYSQDPTANWLSLADKSIFGESHLYTKSAVDPEGLISTISAIAHTMIGFMFGKIATSATTLRTHADKALWLMIAGALIGFAGWLISFGLPLNKRVWSPSYVLATCGMASMALAIIIYLVDMKASNPLYNYEDKRNLSKDAHVAITITRAFGMNPLFLYVASEVIGIVFGAFGIKQCIYEYSLDIIGNGYWASVVYSLIFVALHIAMAMWLWKKRIFIKL